MKIYSVHFDGSFSPWTTKIAGYGFTIHHEGQLVKSGNGVVGQGPSMSCNVAEFGGLFKALQTLRALEPGQCIVNVYGDSQLVIKIMTRIFKASKDKLYYPAYVACDSIVRQLRCMGYVINFEWKRRCYNQEADALSTKHRLADT